MYGVNYNDWTSYVSILNNFSTILFNQKHFYIMLSATC